MGCGSLSQTPTNAPSFTQTSTPISIQSFFTPTKTVLSAPSPLKDNFLDTCQEEFFVEYTKISPDGFWLAETCFPDWTMQVSNRDGTKVFSINHKDYLYDPLFPELSGTVQPVHWTDDSKFIYFIVTQEQWNDGAYLALSSFVPLLCRLDVETGEIKTILFGTVYYSFSPNSKKLITIQEFENPVNLFIHDLETETSQAIIPDNNSKYSQAVRILWSPDSSKFVFIAALGNEYGDEINQPNVQSMILVNLSDLSQEVIIKEMPDLIQPASWDEDGIILYHIMSYENMFPVTTYSYDTNNETTEVIGTFTP